jgi:addiction module HigA family antidote
MATLGMSRSSIIIEEVVVMLPIHPGRILKRELSARKLSANRLAIALRLPSGRITDIVNGKRGISPDTALRLGRYFTNAPRFWLNLQTAYELALAEREIGDRIEAEILPDAA